MKKELDGKINDYCPKTGQKLTEEKKSLSPQDFIAFNELKIRKDFLRENESGEDHLLTKSQIKGQMEILVAILNGFEIKYGESKD